MSLIGPRQLGPAGRDVVTQERPRETGWPGQTNIASPASNEPQVEERDERDCMLSRDYVNMRRNAGSGRAYENEILSLPEVGLEKKNFTLFQRDSTTDAFGNEVPGEKFIPDGVKGNHPDGSDLPQFVEIKDYEHTTLNYSSNATKQVEYLIDWAKKNPDKGRPSFELYISNEDMVGRDFQRLLDRASRAGVDVKVIEVPRP
jgi:hypothetical protein